MSFAGFPSSSLISNATVCVPAASTESSFEERTPPVIAELISTPSTKILPEVKSRAELSETAAENATLFPVIAVPFSRETAVSDVEYVGVEIVGSILSSTAEL